MQHSFKTSQKSVWVARASFDVIFDKKKSMCKKYMKKWRTRKECLDKLWKKSSPHTHQTRIRSLTLTHTPTLMDFGRYEARQKWRSRMESDAYKQTQEFLSILIFCCCSHSFHCTHFFLALAVLYYFWSFVFVSVPFVKCAFRFSFVIRVAFCFSDGWAHVKAFWCACVCVRFSKLIYNFCFLQFLRYIFFFIFFFCKKNLLNIRDSLFFVW